MKLSYYFHTINTTYDVDLTIIEFDIATNDVHLTTWVVVNATYTTFLDLTSSDIVITTQFLP